MTMEPYFLLRQGAPTLFGEIEGDALHHLPDLLKNYAHVFGHSCIPNAYMESRSEIHLHLWYRVEQRQLESLCASFRVRTGKDLELKTVRRQRRRHSGRREECCSEHGVDQPVFVTVVEPLENGEGRSLGRIVSLVRLATLDLAECIPSDPLDPTARERLFPSCFGGADGEGQTPFISAERLRVESRLGNGKHKMVKRGAEVVRGIADQRPKTQSIRLPVGVDPSDVAAALILDILPKSIRVSTLEIRDLVLERIHVFVRPLNLREGVGKVDGHGRIGSRHLRRQHSTDRRDALLTASR